MRINENVDELFMDMECQGECAQLHKDPDGWNQMLGRGTQVRWNPVAKLSLCAVCQDRWSWYGANGQVPPWMQKLWDTSTAGDRPSTNGRSASRVTSCSSD